VVVKLLLCMASGPVNWWCSRCSHNECLTATVGNSFICNLCWTMLLIVHVGWLTAIFIVQFSFPCYKNNFMIFTHVTMTVASRGACSLVTTHLEIVSHRTISVGMFCRILCMILWTWYQSSRCRQFVKHLFCRKRNSVSNVGCFECCLNCWNWYASQSI